MSFLIMLPLPASFGLRAVNRREGTKSAGPKAGELRSYVGSFTYRKGEETITTEPEGNSGHNVPLNAEQFERMAEVIATLERGAAEDATSEEKKARKALIETIRTDGGISLPVPQTAGRKGSKVENIADLFAGLSD